MDTLQSLLSADEERVRQSLRAGQTVDRSSQRSRDILRDELGALLLRYNAERGEDRLLQSAADAVTATARDSLELLAAGRAELRKGERKSRPGAPWLLMLAVALGAAALFLGQERLIAAGICAVLAIVCGFWSGRTWVRETAPRAEYVLDADALWHGMTAMTETMDRKLLELSERRQEEDARRARETGEELPFSPAELSLLGDLLEALTMDNGEYALRQLKKLRPFLREKGLETVEFSRETADWFERLPTKKQTATLRPALVYRDRLVLAGRAAENVDENGG